MQLRARLPLPGELDSHFIVPGSTSTLCATPMTGEWKAGPPPDGGVTCWLCAMHRIWLPVLGKLEFEATLEVMVEPWPAGQRKHITGDDDPERGRLHRPAHLQVCSECCQARGPQLGFDNLCKCDFAVWDRHPLPRAWDLTSNAHICSSCVAALTIPPGDSRWSSYFCPECRPRVIRLNKLAGRCLVPIGPHSMMNGGFGKVEGETIDGSEQISFTQDLISLFHNQTRFWELTLARVATRLQELGVEGHAIVFHDYVEGCRNLGWDAKRGFEDLVVKLDVGLDTEAASYLWKLVPEEKEEPDE